MLRAGLSFTFLLIGIFLASFYNFTPTSAVRPDFNNVSNCQITWPAAPDVFLTGHWNKDGFEDLFVRLPCGIAVYKSNKYGSFSEVSYCDQSQFLSDENGWDTAYYKGTIRLGDYDGDGDSDIYVRAHCGIIVLRNNGDGTWSNATVCDPSQSTNANIYYAGYTLHRGWADNSSPNYPDEWFANSSYKTLSIGSWDGGIPDDLFSRVNTPSNYGSWIKCSYFILQNNHDGTWTPQPREFECVGTEGLSNYDGYNQDPYWTDIKLGDVDNDERSDVFFRNYEGVFVSNPSVNPKKSHNTGVPFSDANGWNLPEQYNTVMVGDYDNDGYSDIFGRGPNGMEVWRNPGGTGANYQYTPFTQVANASQIPWSNAMGWNKPQYYLTISLHDFDGDEVDEIYGRGPNGIDIYTNHNNKYFLSTSASPAFSDSNGWNKLQYYSSIRAGNFSASPYHGFISLTQCPSNRVGLTVSIWDQSVGV